HALIAHLVGKLHDQDAVLGGDPHQHDQSDITVDVQCAVGQEQAKQRAEDCQGHSCHDDERMHEAFKLRRQHQEHHHQRHAEDQHDAAAGLLEFQGFTLVVNLRVLGQLLEHHILQEGQRLIEADPRCQVAADGDRPNAVITAQIGGAGAVLDGDQVGERDQLSRGLGTYIDVGQVAGRGTLRIFCLQDDVILFAAVLESGDPTLVHHRLQGTADGLDRNSQISGTNLVYGDIQARLGFVVVGLQTAEQAAGLGTLDHQVAPAGNLLILATTQHELHRVATSTAHQTRTHEGVHFQTRVLRPLGDHLVHDLFGGPWTLPPLRQRDDGHAAIDAVATAKAWHLEDHVLDFAGFQVRQGFRLQQGHALLHVFQTGPFGAVHTHHEYALIFGRRKGGGNVLHQEVDASANQSQGDEHPACMLQTFRQALPIGALQPAEHVIHAPGHEAV